MVKHRNEYKVFIPAGLFIGIGVGLLIGNVAAGTLIGLGVGYIFAYVIKHSKDSKKG
jgi:hypothetical protein